MTDDVRKLLGGYSTGTLTEEEQKALYEAALEDPALFEALADEQVLRDLLEEPAARARVLQATENPPFSMWGIIRDWWDSPKSKALVGTAAVLLLAICWSVIRDSRNTQDAAYVAKIQPPRLRQSEAPGPANRRPDPLTESRSPVAESLRSAPDASKSGETSAPRVSGASDQRRETGGVVGGMIGAARAPSMTDTVAAPAAAPSAPPPPPPAASELVAPQMQAAFRDAERSGGSVAVRKETTAAANVEDEADSREFRAANGFRYTLERRNSSGEFVGVETATELPADESVRLRLFFPVAGTALVSTDLEKNVAGIPVEAGAPVIVPVPSGVRRVLLSFSPSTLLRNSLTPGLSAVSSAKRRVPSDSPSPQSSAAPAKDSSAPSTPTPFNIEIPIRRK